MIAIVALMDGTIAAISARPVSEPLLRLAAGLTALTIVAPSLGYGGHRAAWRLRPIEQGEVLGAAGERNGSHA